MRSLAAVRRFVTLMLIFAVYRQSLLRSAYSLAEFVSIMDGQGLFMNSQAANQASVAISQFVKTFFWLAHDAFTRNELLFKIRPKLHLFHHWGVGPASLRQRPLNPKSYSCWTDEDFVRRICSICSGCGHLGVRPSLMSRYVGAVMESWLELSKAE
jgi:hypothetical protein